MSADNQGWFKASDPADACPPPDELWGFGRGHLTAARRDALRAHLEACVWCAEKMARISDPAGIGGTAEAPPETVNRKLRAHWHASPFARVWRSQILWMLLFIGSIGVSFADSRHYKQWLVIALVTGVRWAMAERAARHWITVTRGSAASALDRTRASQSSSSSEQSPTARL